MKKVLFSLMVFFGGFAFSQDYVDTYPDYYGYEYYDDSNNYPDDYYYNYPTDYYPTDYYQSYYNDYNTSITTVNWNRFFREYRLSNWQRNQIIMLNNRFASYNAWNMYYGMNPDRWYYDRFYALERILGSRLFATYQNMYYQNYSPIVYFQNYRRSHYVVHYHVVPKYRYVDVGRYRVYKNDFKNSYQNTRNMAMLDTRSTSPIRSGQNGNDRNKAMLDSSNPRSTTTTTPVRNNNRLREVNIVRETQPTREVSSTRSVRAEASNVRSTSRSATPSVRFTSSSSVQNNNRSSSVRSSGSNNAINNSSRTSGSRGGR